MICLGGTLLIGTGFLPVASAHGGEHTPDIPQWYALVVLLGGFAVIGTSVLLERRDHVSSTRNALYGVFAGILLTIAGGIGIVQLSRIDTYSAASMPFPREWYLPIALFAGFSIVMASVVLGQFRWRTRPRYTVLGTLLGLWVAYPALVRGNTTYHHPIGYVIVACVPLVLGYIVWIDGRALLAQIRSDTVARRFGLGVGLSVSIFFMFSTGMLSFVPEEGTIDGVDLMHVPPFLDTQPAANPLVLWPAVEFWLPQIPFSGLLSVGTLILVGILGGLVGLNAAVVAHQWVGGSGGNSTQSTAGAAAIVGPNACGCCGPMLAELAVVVIGPSAAAPLYWLFVDLSSPVGSLFFVVSVALLTGSFVYAANELTGGDRCAVPAAD